jgi:hypothetical protein
MAKKKKVVRKKKLKPTFSPKPRRRRKPFTPFDSPVPDTPSPK